MKKWIELITYGMTKYEIQFFKISGIAIIALFLAFILLTFVLLRR